MPVTVVVGGQYGSEGKGKVAHFLVRETKASVAVRVGGPNSGHTTYDRDGNRYIFRQLPAAVLEPETICVLGAGSLIDADVLREEIERVCLSPERLMIDPGAFVITEEHKRRERESLLHERIGSTLCGVGEAVIERIRRRSSEGVAAAHPYLHRFTINGPVRSFLRNRLVAGERIVIEGTQGFGLSSPHSPHYPHATSRDTTAAAFVAEAGLSPLDVDDVVLVLRAFPIRVGGNSGPLPLEIDWPTVARESGSPYFVERTTVTNSVRRVARFDPSIVCAAIEANAPTRIVLNHVDYFDFLIAKARRLTPWAHTQVSSYEELIGRSFSWIGLSPTSLVARSEHGVPECSDLIENPRCSVPKEAISDEHPTS